jgi:hypothetical protein
MPAVRLPDLKQRRRPDFCARRSSIQFGSGDGPDLMSHRERGTNLVHSGGRMKQRLAHGVREFFTVFLFLAPWFLAFSTYRILLLKRFADEPFEYGTGLLNALILSKVILTGEYLQLGKRQENKPLIYPTIWKAFLFTLLATAHRPVARL